MFIVSIEFAANNYLYFIFTVLFSKTKLLYICEIIIYLSSENEVFMAEIPEFPRRMIHGNTLEDALKIPRKEFNYGLIQPENSATLY